MSNGSVYGFEIPHDAGEPCRDIIAIQIPYPPSKVRSIWIPDISRDLGQHGVQAGIIRQMGPLAFQYKDGDGVSRQTAHVGDWVLIKWGAGTMFQAGRGILNAVGGWRYISSFNDVIKIIPAKHMPDPATLEWTDEGVSDFETTTDKPPPVDASVLPAGVRERVVYGAGK
jgi:hypothetical protein